MSTHEERRRSPRIALGRLHGKVPALDIPVAVREISLGGMSLQTAEPLEIGSILDVRLPLGDGSYVVLQGRVLRSSRIESEGDPPAFVSGVQFVGDDTDGPVGGLLGRLS